MIILLFFTSWTAFKLINHFSYLSSLLFLIMILLLNYNGPYGPLCRPMNDIDWKSERVSEWVINTLRLRQNRRHFADYILKCIFLNENVSISMKIPLKFIPKVPINNIPTLVQIMAWHRSGTKPLSEPMIVRSLMHICIARPQWV